MEGRSRPFFNILEMNMKLVKCGDRTIVSKGFGPESEIKNRLLGEEANFAMDLIMGDRSDRVPGAVVERAFAIAKEAFRHIKVNRMDTPFPFAKVFQNEDV